MAELDGTKPRTIVEYNVDVPHAIAVDPVSRWTITTKAWFLSIELK